MDSWVTAALPGAIAYAASLLSDRSQAEDVVQECVCRLLVHAARYDLPRDGRRLLFRAITNACINLQTRSKKIISLDDDTRSPDGGKWEMADVAAAAPPTLAMADEMRQAIGEGLQTLPLRQRSALELSSLGYKHIEIAEMLTIDPDHVRVLLFRARKAMATFLNRRFLGGVVP